MRSEHYVALCRQLCANPTLTQRDLASRLGVSLGLINLTLKESIVQGYLRKEGAKTLLTDEGQSYLDQFKVDNAIILAAGFGSRFVPFTYETPKGLLKVKGVPMVERQIEQLIAAGIKEIIIVVGYRKEAFDYLIDKYGVTLVYNPEYAEKNNFVSMYYALDYLKSTYVLMSDNWIEESIFNAWESRCWFSCLYFEGKTAEWIAHSGSRDKITKIEIGGEDAWAILGPAYFTRDFSETFAELIREHYHSPGTDNDYWEHILKDNLGSLPPMYMNKQSRTNVYEFENLEELREFDESYRLDSDNVIIREISQALNVSPDMICRITPLKVGASNLSFTFYVDSQGYVFRTPGLGTEKLINHAQEKAAYDVLIDVGITDEIVAFNSQRGTKITKFYEGVHVVDPSDVGQLTEAVRLIKTLHTSGLSTGYACDIEKMISCYRDLAEEINAIRFVDFDEVTLSIDKLLNLKRKIAVEPVLCHGDFTNTNVILFPDGSGKLIDWEYSGMADPIMDISMFAIDSIMDRPQIDQFMRMYISEPTREEWCRLYLYVALGGFLWSIWAEYKQASGQEFGEYPLKMYRYAKDYYSILVHEGYLA
ncbi:MAG: phosphotransferase [Propionibacteriaceae bacterium]|nr:phosphotransferase [Propionibacteriaceae bacterium]